jgi:hypothetical protein
MTQGIRAAASLGLAASTLAGCVSLQYSRMAAPDGASALGLEFGAERGAVVRSLRAEGIAVRDAAGDLDAVVASRCPSAPRRKPCRLLFGPQGLYAAEIEVPASEAQALRSSVEAGLGMPDREDDGAPPVEGIPTLLASWHLAGWTVSVARAAPQVTPATAALRVERDAAAPPVVAGVPLGRVRDEVEAALDRQGAILVQRDDVATTYLGCPQGAPEALSCVVTFHEGRAAALTEVLPGTGGDREALAAWRRLAQRYERDIGRAPQRSCPETGPERIGGDCTATWSSDRLVVVVGAHRNAGASHRGTISVYTAFTYPALAPAPAPDEEIVDAK